MNSVRRWIRDVFGFSGTEINGFLVLLPLMLLLVLSEPLYRAHVSGRHRTEPADAQKLDSLTRAWRTLPEDEQFVEPQQVSFFQFDPNEVSVNDMLRLGIPERLANRIAAYRSKGGVFHTRSDLMKIYGLDSSLYKQLYAYIRLPSRRYSKAVEEGKRPRPEPEPEERIPTKDFDINTADTTTFMSIYGIGPVLAGRIVRFRDALGGFVKPEQLYEVYGLDSITADRLRGRSYIKPGFVPRQLDLNGADADKMGDHPYVSKRLASLLIRYRNQHGDFLRVEDIKKLAVLKAEEAERLLPYLKVENEPRP